jgi:hypothetical protein
MWIRIEIDDRKLYNFTPETSYCFIRIAIFLSLGLARQTIIQKMRKRLQPLKTSSTLKHEISSFFTIFEGNFCSPGSKSAIPMRNCDTNDQFMSIHLLFNTALFVGAPRRSCLPSRITAREDRPLHSATSFCTIFFVYILLPLPLYRSINSV